MAMRLNQSENKTNQINRRRYWVKGWGNVRGNPVSPSVDSISRNIRNNRSRRRLCFHLVSSVTFPLFFLSVFLSSLTQYLTGDTSSLYTIVIRNHDTRLLGSPCRVALMGLYLFMWRGNVIFEGLSKISKVRQSNTLGSFRLRDSPDCYYINKS